MNKPNNELATLFKQWNDLDYLQNFFIENYDDLQEFFYIKRVSEAIEEAIEDTINEAEQLERLILDIPYADNLDEIFLPLGSNDMSIRELVKLNQCHQFLLNIGVFDSDSFLCQCSKLFPSWRTNLALRFSKQLLWKLNHN